jgi:microcystin-dependent protein
MKSFFTPVLLLTLVFLVIQPCQAQTGVGTNTPDAHAMLDISSTQKGLLLPRLTTAQQATLSGTLTNAQAGMLVTDAVSGKPICWTGTAWKDASASSLSATGPFVVSSTNNVFLNPGTAAGDLISWDGANWVSTLPGVQHFTITQDNVQPYLALNYCIALQGVFPSRNSSEPFLSEIELFSFNFAPKGFAVCNGQLLPINQNQAIFALLGTTYGGNGTTNFALPNLQGRAPLHFGTGAGLSPYTLGQAGGSESATITK